MDIRHKEIEDIKTMIQYQESISNSFKRFFESIVEKWNIILIGGSLREAIKGNYKPRDIDIIIDSNNMSEFEAILINDNIFFKRNRFGGYKILFDKIEVDVWSINKHYAFDKNYYNESIENIVETTFLNYDSIVYDYKDGKLYMDNYKKCLNSHMIELIGTKEYIFDNPTPYINIARMLKIKKETGYDLSKNAIEYIQEYYNKCNNSESNLIKQLDSGYKLHYKKSIDKCMCNLLEDILQKV